MRAAGPLSTLARRAAIASGSRSYSRLSSSRRINNANNVLVGGLAKDLRQHRPHVNVDLPPDLNALRLTTRPSRDLLKRLDALHGIFEPSRVPFAACLSLYQIPRLLLQASPTYQLSFLNIFPDSLQVFGHHGVIRIPADRVDVHPRHTGHFSL